MTLEHRLGIDDLDPLLFQQDLHGLAQLLAAEMPDLDRQLGLMHVPEQPDRNPGAGEVALAAGADHNPASGKTVFGKSRPIVEPLVDRCPELLHQALPLEPPGLLTQPLLHRLA